MEQTEITNYVPILLVFIIAVAFVAVMILVSRLAGYNRPTRVKLMPYECGVEPVGTARERQSVKFYLVAMVFLLFDIEAVFLIPWAVVFPNIVREQASSTIGYIFYSEMMLFVLVLLIGLVYVWRKGILEWNR
jgi:NADH-quinone oxidoreductase subunit A